MTDRKITWGILHDTYLQATYVCDPLEFLSRQKKLVLCIAEYLIEKDRPEAEPEPDEEEMHEKIEKIQKMVKKEKAALQSLKKADIKQDKKLEKQEHKKKRK